VTILLNGLVQGVIYGFIALGIVLIYKGTRIFNFAQAEFATTSMFVLWLLRVGSEPSWLLPLPYWLAAILAVLAAVIMALLTDLLVMRPLANSPRVIALVGTAGVGLLAIGIQFWLGKPQPRSVPAAVTEMDIQLFGLFISGQQLLSLLCLIVVAAGAALFFQRTYLGMAILANSQDSMAAQIVGANPRRISLVTWGIAGFLGGMAGVLFAPQVTLVPGFMTTNILIPAFTVAVVGGMTSLVGAFVAGGIVGVIGAVGQEVPGLQDIPEPSIVLLFIVLVIMLALRPRGLFGTEA
jgi:branched-chain amino acid transport system permease protein